MPGQSRHGPQESYATSTAAIYKSLQLHFCSERGIAATVKVKTPRAIPRNNTNLTLTNRTERACDGQK